ncbi:class I SAM-dependent methyltransferase [Altererythrobacter sp. GH1-8]|uniref:class I SAM-dependent methyltransferase n=1 Tax=Altererythrobacter sp. GH1-8 TaxID=3349333 RepID=UPI00374D4EBE
MSARIAFQPNHDEASRQAFVASFKKYVNFDVESKLGEVFDKQLAPSAATPPETRDDAAALMEPHPLYQLWASLTFHSQNLMWNAVQDTTDRTIDEQIDAYRSLSSSQDRRGSVSLSDELLVKAPISTTEIHRQPGGYWRERRADDIEVALNYAGTVDLYRNAKGMGIGSKPAADAIGQFVASIARKYAPDLEPATILDMGCGTGEQTLGYKRAFPDAEVTGIDVARPFIRFAHGLAESEGLAVHFAEMDAGATRFEDESFDLIVSIIMFHETTKAQVHDIMRECWRLVRPGGLVLHLDVPYQPGRMPLVKQVTNNWQVRYNGEPFWSGFASLDMKEEAVKAGFDPDQAFATYEGQAPAIYHFFGGRKPR